MTPSKSLFTLRILTPPMETPGPPSDTPGASKKVFLTPHDIPRILRDEDFDCVTPRTLVIQWWMLRLWKHSSGCRSCRWRYLNSCCFASKGFCNNQSLCHVVTLSLLQLQIWNKSNLNNLVKKFPFLNLLGILYVCAMFQAESFFRSNFLLLLKMEIPQLSQCL